ncbi:hypothetical protein LCGC14_2468570 [marine sediment metagenome]|uniref:V-SNARE coiled-coil homology domain-containing protein n=1 Tax=marine sediment metagenome TaxID=412755 RepID=A0A0F9BBN8_9ZZZZ
MNDSQRDELLVRVDERVHSIQNTLKRGALRMDDHGKRINLLERWRSAIVAGIAVVLFLIGVVLKVAS